MRDILVISLLAVICGADSWTDIETFGECKEEFFKSFLELPNGIPSHDTFSRFYSLLEAEEFEKCFMSWISELVEIKKGEIIAIDGKTTRASRDSNKKKNPLHLVSAWASENRMVLGQQSSTHAGGELTAMEELLDKLDLTGATVTIDAIGCQKHIAEKIYQRGANYMLAVKGNQGNLHEKLKHIFNYAEKTNYQAMVYERDEKIDKGHGRIEKRTCTALHVMYAPEFKLKWSGLQTLIKIESDVLRGEKQMQETRYYISSLAPNAADCAKAIRTHWHIENELHWCLDMSFQDDRATTRVGNSAENMAVLRRIALNILKKDNSRKASIRAKRKIGGWDNSFLIELLRQCSLSKKCSA
jgi:predicted transposase YbfD/YdcC